MNYTLQVLKGRSDVASLRLIDGVNSVGRHDDCVIRIRSSQVSRRHCEILEVDGRLMVRDLGSSNGTYVNGLRVLGQQPLSPGDVVSIGGVALRVVPIGQELPPVAPPSAPMGETAELEEVVDAEAVAEADDFEVGLDADDEEGFQMGGDAIALDDDVPTPPPSRPVPAGSAEDETVDLAVEEGGGEVEDDAVAQFLMDLKLDEED